MDDEEQIFIANEQRRPVKSSRFAACCVTLSLLTTSILCTVLVVRARFEVVSTPKAHSLWFPLAGSESCIRLTDIDGDELDDVIVATSEVTAITSASKDDKNRSLLCESWHVEEPCSGTVYGIRGYDFSVLWSFRIKESIFELACNLIDIDQDGHADCIGAGRQGTIVAFSPRRGQLIWDGRKIQARGRLWNFYNPVLLAVDVDHDGMNDILISHGGNPTIPSDVHEREAGCLLIVSSRTGEQIGAPFWMPDGKETYMSPIMYDNGTILFGTGGETVPGGLYSMSVDDLLKGKHEYVTLIRSSMKGIMVPPIILDFDNDGVKDILVSAFDGTLELIQGKTMKSLWTRMFDGCEFYTTPAPGDFNGDSYVDFMLIVNRGEWDRYEYSEVQVIDGLTGETIWKQRNAFGEFTAPLTLQMQRNRKYQDSFIYRQRGQISEGGSPNTSSILFHGIGLQDGEISKNDMSISPSVNRSCGTFTLRDSIASIYLASTYETRPIGRIYPPMSRQNDFCSDFEPMERSGGAIGDLDGDGRLETVDITTFITKLTSHTLHSFVAHSVLTRFSLDPNIDEPQIVANYEADISNSTVDQQLVQSLRAKLPSPMKSSGHNTDLHVVAKQTWNAYLGRDANSHYYRSL